MIHDTNNLIVYQIIFTDEFTAMDLIRRELITHITTGRTKSNNHLYPLQKNI